MLNCTPALGVLISYYIERKNIYLWILFVDSVFASDVLTNSSFLSSVYIRVLIGVFMMIAQYI